MKKTIALIALLMVAAVLLTACGNGLEGPTWIQDGQTPEVSYTFKNGKLTMSGGGVSMEGTYKIDGKKVTLTLPEALGGESITMEFKVEGNKLTLTNDGNSQTFTKK